MALCKGNQYSKHRYAIAPLACLHICASGGGCTLLLKGVYGRPAAIIYTITKRFHYPVSRDTLSSELLLIANYSPLLFRLPAYCQTPCYRLAENLEAN